MDTASRTERAREGSVEGESLQARETRLERHVTSHCLPCLLQSKLPLKPRRIETGPLHGAREVYLAPHTHTHAHALP